MLDTSTFVQCTCESISKLLFFKKCLFINIWEQCVIINFTNKVHTKGINQAFLSLFEWERIFRLQHHNNNGYLKSHSMYYSDPFMKMYRGTGEGSPPSYEMEHVAFTLLFCGDVIVYQKASFCDLKSCVEWGN